MPTLAARAHTLFNGRNAEQVAAILGLTSEELYARLIDPSLADPPAAGGSDIDLAALPADGRIAFDPTHENIHPDGYGGLVIEPYFYVQPLDADYDTVPTYAFMIGDYGVGISDHTHDPVVRGFLARGSGRGDFNHLAGTVIINPGDESGYGHVMHQANPEPTGVDWVSFKGVPGEGWRIVHGSGSDGALGFSDDAHTEVARLTPHVGGGLDLTGGPLGIGKSIVDPGYVGAFDTASYTYIDPSGYLEMVGGDGMGGHFAARAGGGMDFAGGPLSFADVLVLEGVAGVGSNVLYASVLGDADDRFTLTNEGRMKWGGGTLGPDTELHYAASGLQTNRGLSMWGHAPPVAQPARPTDLPGLIDLVVQYGLCS